MSAVPVKLHGAKTQLCFDWWSIATCHNGEQTTISCVSGHKHHPKHVAGRITVLIWSSFISIEIPLTLESSQIEIDINVTMTEGDVNILKLIDRIK